jgi:hypothetical protein
VGWLKALGRERDLCLGIYAGVASAGRIALGDRLEVVRMKHSPSD